MAENALIQARIDAGVKARAGAVLGAALAGMIVVLLLGLPLMAAQVALDSTLFAVLALPGSALTLWAGWRAAKWQWRRQQLTLAANLEEDARE